MELPKSPNSRAQRPIIAMVLEQTVSREEVTRTLGQAPKVKKIKQTTSNLKRIIFREMMLLQPKSIKTLIRTPTISSALVINTLNGLIHQILTLTILKTKSAIKSPNTEVQAEKQQNRIQTEQSPKTQTTYLRVKSEDKKSINKSTPPSKIKRKAILQTMKVTNLKMKRTLMMTSIFPGITVKTQKIIECVPNSIAQLLKQLHLQQLLH